MSADTNPRLTGVHHFSPTVRDVEASAEWYQRVFGMVRLPVVFEHHDREDTGYAVIVADPTSGVVIGLHHHVNGTRDLFDEGRTGLDHIGFGVPSRENLDAWVRHLDELGIEHSGVRDIAEPSPFSTLVFRDPDNIQLELVYQA